MVNRKDNKGRVLYKGECQRKDGSYVFTYFNRQGKRVYRYSKTLKGLRIIEDEINRYTMDGLNIEEAKKITLNMIFDRYINTRVELKTSSIESYKYFYNKYVRDSIGKRTVKSITYLDLKEFFTDLYQKYNFKNTTIKNIHSVISPLFLVAIREEIILKNPTTNLIKELNKIYTNRITKKQALSQPEIEAFFSFCETNSFYRSMIPMYKVMLGTGCRIGEVGALTWNDIDFRNRIISINHNISRFTKGNKDAAYDITTPKTSSGFREIPMSNELYDVFCELNKHRKVSEYSVNGYKDFVFTNRNGKPKVFSNINRQLTTIVKNYNELETLLATKENREPIYLPHISCHTFRHTFASRLCAIESNFKVIQELMGHSSVTTTYDYYTSVSLVQKQTTINKLSNDLGIL